MTVKRRLLLSSIIPIVLVLLFFMFWYYSYYLENIEAEKKESSHYLVHEILDLVLLTDEYYAYSYLRLEQQWLFKYNNILSIINSKKYFPNSLNSDLEHIKQTFTEIRDLGSESEDLGNDESNEDKLNQYIELQKYLLSNLRFEIREIMEEVHVLYKSASIKIEEISKRTIFLISIYGIFVIIISLLNAIFTYKSIIPPLKELVNGASVIESGEYEFVFGKSGKKPVINPNNEIGALAISFNSMTIKLVGLIESLKTEAAEREEVEVKLRIERDNLKHILDSMDDGVYIINQQYDIQYVNPVLVEEFGEHEGKKCYLYFHDRTEVCPWCKNSDILKGKTVHWEWFSAKNGKTYDLVDTPLINSDGSISKLEISRDISNRKKAENDLLKHKEDLEIIVNKRTLKIEESKIKLEKSQQATLFLLEDMKDARFDLLNLNKNLERSNKDLEAFSHSVSHDLRSPLRAVLGFSVKLHKHISNSADPESIRLIDVISENTIKMQNLITDLLAYSKVGTSNLSKSEIDMNQLGEVLNTDYENLVKEKGIVLEILSLPKAYGNYSMIKQVLVNLLDNAIKFNNKGKKSLITIGYSKENKGAYYIKDNGCGFDSKFSNEVFKIFKRVNANSSIEGTGVGLAIVKRIIESHGGEVWVESKPDGGSIFFFTLQIPKK